jgi:hypothetical protein
MIGADPYRVISSEFKIGTKTSFQILLFRNFLFTKKRTKDLV